MDLRLVKRASVLLSEVQANTFRVRHVHTHIIPRKESDLERTDDIYPMMEGEEGNIGEHLRQHQARDKARTRGSVVIEDEDRKPRSQEEMDREARWLESEMESDLGRG